MRRSDLNFHQTKYTRCAHCALSVCDDKAESREKQTRKKGSAERKWNALNNEIGVLLRRFEVGFFVMDLWMKFRPSVLVRVGILKQNGKTRYSVIAEWLAHWHYQHAQRQNFARRSRNKMFSGHVYLGVMIKVKTHVHIKKNQSRFCASFWAATSTTHSFIQPTWESMHLCSTQNNCAFHRIKFDFCNSNRPEWFGCSKVFHIKDHQIRWFIFATMISYAWLLH